MVNTEDFIKRLEIILDYYSLNASSFADKIGVQRSSLSHLLSGRNKPSLDFILKILDVFPDVDLYWILNGKGSFPKNSEHIRETGKIAAPIEVQKISALPAFDKVEENLFSGLIKTDSFSPLDEQKREEPNDFKNQNEHSIDKIVVFYKNGTFKSYVHQ